MKRKILALSLMISALLAVAVGPVTAGPGNGLVPTNMEAKFAIQGDVGADIEFLERRQTDGSLKRYALVGMMGHGLNIIDITNPDVPVLTGVAVDPGFNWEADIQVNPKRNLAIIATESPGATVGNGTSGGLAFVDLTNLSMPTVVGHITLTGGAHNVTIVDDQYVYGLLPTNIVDYTNPAAPVFKKPAPAICGHDLTLDLNQPGIAYSACPSSNKALQIVNVADPLNPVIIKDINNSKISIGHQADPSVDSSFVVVTDERGGGLTYEKCPGGGLHIYDISGKYVAGASLSNPKLMGAYFAPFYDMTGDSTKETQWGNCTIHVLTLQAERNLMSVGHYSAGSFIADLSGPTKTTGGIYQEWSGDNGFGGKTTWGNTQGNILIPGAETWSAKWSRFDDALFDRYVFTSDITRGFDVFKYTGPLSKKMARLKVNAASTGGAVTGKLDRYAVYTYQGSVNKPFAAGQQLSISVDGAAPVTVSTAADGTFSLAAGLAAGTHSVAVTWAGDTNYDPASVTQTVTA